MSGCVELCKQQVQSIVSGVEETFLERVINEQSEVLNGSIPDIVNSVIEHLFENGYPGDNEMSSSFNTNSGNSVSSVLAPLYIEQSIILLQNNFPWVSSSIIKKVFYESNNYTKSFTELDTVLKQIFSGKVQVENSIIQCFLRKKRFAIEINDLCDELSKELEKLGTNKDETSLDGDMDCKGVHNGDHEQKIECGCCYNEVSFESMVQCTDGHLFCCSCLQNFTKEVIYGSVMVNLVCMTDGCNCKFSAQQLKKALDETNYEKYMERVQTEEIELANLKNLIKCPHCLFAAEVDNDDKKFCCQNPLCFKATCRYCKAEWDGHDGITCEEFGKNGPTRLRTSYEEKMTEAKVRKCPQCGTIFIKSDGCNKMTCRCGTKMCYICRNDKIDYDHFCQHPKNPDEECNKCKKCSLWTDPSEDDDRAVAEIKKKAEEDGKLLQNNGQILVGPSLVGDDNMNNSDDSFDEYYGSSEDESDNVSDDDSSDESDCDSIMDSDDISDNQFSNLDQLGSRIFTPSSSSSLDLDTSSSNYDESSS